MQNKAVTKFAKSFLFLNDFYNKRADFNKKYKYFACIYCNF